MYLTTLTAVVAIVAFFILLGGNPSVSARNPDSRQTDRVTYRVAPRPASPDEFPRLSRNRWARQDLARMLMTDDDYAGHISPQSRPHRDETA